MAQEPEIIEPGTVLAGRYRVERRLGQGGMGSVFLVQHMHTDQQLALKVLHATVVKDAVALDRFRREARTPARIQSDHVVQVTDADVAPELGGVPFLVMEWLRGQDLAQLSAHGPLPPQEVVLYLRQAARALDKAHALGIVHRDLKPDNLFLTTREDGTPWVKLLDFGIAKLTGASNDLAKMGSATSTGQVFGTPMYMAPEQAKAELDKISPQTDIWALGLIAQKLLSGVEFWSAQTLTHLLAQIVYEPIPPPSAKGCDFGPAYDAWFLRCCSREPEERFASVGEAVTALAAALRVTETGSLPVEARISSTSQPPYKREKRDEAIAFAETAHDAGSTDDSARALPRDSIRITDAPQERQEARRPPRARIAAIVAALVIGAVGLWLAIGRSTETPPLEDVASQPTIEGQPGASPRDVGASVTVTPSVAQEAAPPALAEPAPSAGSAPRGPDGAVETSEPKRAEKPHDPGPGRASLPAAPPIKATAKPAEAPPTPAAPPPPATSPPAAPPPAKEPAIDPMGTRH